MTYSIIGRDPASGELGVLLASFYYGCAPRTIIAAPGAGIVVMQMVPDMRYAAVGIPRMSEGQDPKRILDDLLDEDTAKPIRQVAMLRVDGSVAVFTGEGCIPSSGHMTGRDCCAQGAMVASESVWIETVKAFEASTGRLADRLVAAMRAGEAAGGDIRGKRTAAMLVISSKVHTSWVKSRPVDIRIDDHSDPLGEVERHLAIQRHMGAIEMAFERGLSGDSAGAVDDYEQIAQAAPEDPDVTMRYAIMLAASGRIDDARQQLIKMASVHSGWAQVPARLIAANMLPDDPRLRNVLGLRGTS